MIQSVAELEEFMSRPSAADTAALAALDGDLLILGVGGKMGPTLALRARRAASAGKRIIAAARFSEPGLREQLEQAGIETHKADLLDPAQLAALPDCANVLAMFGRKFGSTEDPTLTWAMNVYAPGMVCERYKSSRIVAFSSGNVYGYSHVARGGSIETDEPHPVGEYAWTGLGRERIYDYHSRRNGTPTVLLRLNYAIDLRYGVILDIGTQVFERKPIDLSMGAANVIWQGDANSVALRCFPHAASPATVINLTGPETLSVRRIAETIGRHLGIEPVFTGAESTDALLNNAQRCQRLFGYPSVTPEEMMEWTAHWLSAGGSTLNKPTHFEARDGKF
ncbi:MAG TPA: NAD(P)-dependent oxidoreductase [Bryobacteraceae bacterium]|nr:NAD(P)-dependent oxidoreductase [Bryobacteraceae bacterium]